MDDIEKIYNQYFNTVYKYLLFLTHDSVFSEDLTQETFCKALEKLDTFRGECKISVWLCQIAKNLLINEQNKRKKNINIDNGMLETIEDNRKLENDIVLRDEKIILYKKMQKLDNNAKEVIHLRMTGELTFKEIGDILDKTETWARVTFYRAKKKIEESDENE